MKLKINGLIKEPKWTKIKCSCKKGNIEKCYPIYKCIHCSCKFNEDSMPRESFIIKEEGKKREIKEITIKRSTDGYESIIAWSF